MTSVSNLIGQLAVSTHGNWKDGIKTSENGDGEVLEK